MAPVSHDVLGWPLNDLLGTSFSSPHPTDRVVVACLAFEAPVPASALLPAFAAGAPASGTPALPDTFGRSLCCLFGILPMCALVKEACAMHGRIVTLNEPCLSITGRTENYESLIRAAACDLKRRKWPC